MSNMIPTKISYKEEKLKCLLKSHDHADCAFICGDERIPAHKLILACSSPVFELMFFGQFAASEIKVPDIQPEVFKQMLEYTYTNYIDIRTVQNAWSLVYISCKYFINDLLDLCVEFIRTNMCLSDLLISYEYGQFYCYEEVVDLCWRDILTCLKGLVFNTDYHMKQSTLTKILSQKQINASSSDLIVIAVNWAIEECIMLEKEVVHSNIWNILSKADLLKYLNFSMFDHSKYYQDDNYCLCSSSNVCGIIKDLSSTYGKEQFSRTIQEVKPNLLNFEFINVYRIAKNIIFPDIFDVQTVIKCTREIYLFGIVITTLHTPQKADTTSYFSSIRIKITGNNTCYKCVAKEQGIHYDHIQFVTFPMPVKLEKDISYNIVVTYEKESHFERGEVVLHYFSRTIYNRRSSCTIQFNTDFDGGVIQGVSCYPA